MIHDFDALARAANQSNGAMEVMDRLFGAVFALPKWHFVSRGTLPDVQPYIAANAGVAGGQPTLRAFTDPDRAARFARENGLADAQGNVPVLSIPVTGIVEWLERFAAAGVWGIWWNSDTASEGFFGPLASLRAIRDRCASLAQPAPPPQAPKPAPPPPAPAPEPLRAPPTSGMSARSAFIVGWSVGLAELAAELLTLQAGAPRGSAIEHAAAGCLHHSGAHAIVHEAVGLLPGAATPDNAPLLGLHAAYARSWIATNLEAPSVVARAARLGMAGGELVRAVSLLLAVHDPAWLPHLRLDVLGLSAEAARDGATQLGLATGYGALPEAAAGFARALREPMARFSQPCTPASLTMQHPHASGMARAVISMAWSEPLRAALASYPADGGPASAHGLMPPGSSPASAGPMTPAAAAAPPAPAPPPPASPPAAPSSGLAPGAPPPAETGPAGRRPLAPGASAAGAGSSPPGRRPYVMPPEKRLALRDVLARLAAEKVEIDEALRALIEHDDFIVPLSLVIEPSAIVDGQLKVDVPLMLLGDGDRSPAPDAWIFTDEEAARVAHQAAGSLGVHLKKQRGVDVLRRLAANGAIEAIRVNPGSPKEHTFFLGRDAFGVMGMVRDAIAFERLADADGTDTDAFRQAFLALPGIATFRTKSTKAFHTLAGEWTVPFTRPAVGFTTPDRARAYLERLTPETREALERVVPSPRTLADVVADEREIDGLILNPFGPGPGVPLDRATLRRLASGGSPS